jgi:hypothetical protein
MKAGFLYLLLCLEKPEAFRFFHLRQLRLKLPDYLPDKWKMGVAYRKNKFICFCNVVNGSMVELYGNVLIFPGSQEVIGSIPICSTLIIKGLQSFGFVALSFLPEFCQKVARFFQVQSAIF